MEVGGHSGARRQPRARKGVCLGGNKGQWGQLTVCLLAIRAADRYLVSDGYHACARACTYDFSYWSVKKKSEEKF